MSNGHFFLAEAHHNWFVYVRVVASPRHADIEYASEGGAVTCRYSQLYRLRETILDYFPVLLQFDDTPGPFSFIPTFHLRHYDEGCL